MISIPSLFLQLVLLFSLSCIQGGLSTSDLDTIAEIIDWIRSNGGFINEKVEVRTIEGNLSGIFATQDLAWGEVIAHIPWKLIFKVEKDNYTWCDAVENVRSSLVNPDHNHQNPYQRYLAQRSGSHVPHYWSKKGKTLLNDLLEGFEDNGFFTDPDEWWEDVCDRPGDEWHYRAMMLIQTRGDGSNIDLLVPFGDLVNHRNGRYTNVEASIVSGKPYEMQTTRDVKAGEELVSSYNRCPFCDHLYSNPKDASAFQVTPQLFEVYGFVEPIPQRWVLPQHRLMFDIKYANEEEPDEDDLRVDFIAPPSWWALHFLREQLASLHEFEEELKDRKDIPAVELDGLRRFHMALVDAFSLALKFSVGKASERVWFMDENEWYKEDDSDDVDKENDSDDSDDADEENDSEHSEL